MARAEQKMWLHYTLARKFVQGINDWCIGILAYSRSLKLAELRTLLGGWNLLICGANIWGKTNGTTFRVGGNAKQPPSPDPGWFSHTVACRR